MKRYQLLSLPRLADPGSKRCTFLLLSLLGTLPLASAAGLAAALSALAIGRQASSGTP